MAVSEHIYSAVERKRKKRRMGEAVGEETGSMSGTTSLRGLVSHEMQILGTGIQEEEHEDGVEEGVEKPGTDAIATASGEVEEEDAKVPPVPTKDFIIVQ